MKCLDDIFNANNFFSIEGNELIFWGNDIDSRIIKITSYVKTLIDKFQFPEGEIIELYDDDSFQFFKLVYTLKN